MRAPDEPETREHRPIGGKLAEPARRRHTVDEPAESTHASDPEDGGRGGRGSVSDGGAVQGAATAATTVAGRCVTAQTAGDDKDEEAAATAAAKERMAGHAAGAAGVDSVTCERPAPPLHIHTTHTHTHT